MTTLSILYLLAIFVGETYEADNRPFTLVEYADMLESYILNERNAVQAVERYVAAHPDRRHPSRFTFSRTYERLRHTGSVLPDIQNIGHVVDRPLADIFDVEDRILRILTQEPGIGIRDVAHRVGESYSLVQRFLKNIGM